MKQVKLNVLADFSICTIITTRLTKNILKDAVSDLTTARIFKDVCCKRVESQNVSTGKVFTFLFSWFLGLVQCAHFCGINSRRGVLPTRSTTLFCSRTFSLSFSNVNIINSNFSQVTLEKLNSSHPFVSASRNCFSNRETRNVWQRGKNHNICGTLNLQIQTLNPEPETVHLKTQSLSPKP